MSVELNWKSLAAQVLAIHRKLYVLLYLLRYLIWGCACRPNSILIYVQKSEIILRWRGRELQWLFKQLAHHSVNDFWWVTNPRCCSSPSSTAIATPTTVIQNTSGESWLARMKWINGRQDRARNSALHGIRLKLKLLLLFSVPCGGGVCCFEKHGDTEVNVHPISREDDTFNYANKFPKKFTLSFSFPLCGSVAPYNLHREYLKDDYGVLCLIHS